MLGHISGMQEGGSTSENQPLQSTRKKKMNIFLDSAEGFNKIQHSFIIETLSKR